MHGSDGYYYVQINGIKAPKLSENCALKITEKNNDANTVTITYSPFTYAKSYWSDSAVGPLMKQLVKYGNAADNYFNAS